MMPLSSGWNGQPAAGRTHDGRAGRPFHQELCRRVRPGNSQSFVLTENDSDDVEVVPAWAGTGSIRSVIKPSRIAMSTVRHWPRAVSQDLEAGEREMAAAGNAC